MKLSKSLLAGLLALVLILSPLASAMNVHAAETGILELQYRYGTNNLIQMNTNLPSDTPCVNFTTGDNGCSIDQSGNTVQWVGWIGMDNVDGTIVLTFHFNNAFTAGQSYVLPKGAVFGFTDGKTYTLDGDYTFTFDGSSWAMEVENVDEPEAAALNFAYRYGTSTLIQVNTDLPSDTPLVNFTADSNGCSIDQSGNTVQWVGWIQMDNADGTIVLTFHFNNAFTAGQTYFLPAGSVFGFTDGKTYTLTRDYTFTFDGASWSVDEPAPEETEPEATIGELSFQYRWGVANTLQMNTDLPSTTPVKDFLISDNGCEVDESANQYQNVAWIGMANANGTIVLTFNFGRDFEAGQTYFLPAGAIFGFTDGNKYALDKDYTFKYDGSAWAIVEPVKNVSLSYRYGTNNLIQYNTDLPATTPIANFLAGDNGSNLLQSGNQQVGWIEMANANGTIVLTFHFNSAFEVGQSYTLAAESVFGFTDGNSYVQSSGITLYWDGSSWTDTQPHVHSYESVVTPPTAIKEGYTTYTCSGCGDSYVGDTVPALGIGELQFKSANVTLKSDLTVNFSVSADLFIEDAYVNPYVVFTVGNYTTTVTSYTVVDGKYVFACEHLSPSQIGDTMVATLYAELNGEVKSDTKEYSVAQYCYSVLAKTEDATLRTLLVDLLNYGAAAQTYTWYNDKSLCNAALTAEQKAWGTSGDPALSSVLNTKYAEVSEAKASWKAAGLVLENAVTMRFRFAAENVENLSVKLSTANQEWVIDEFEAVAGMDGQYYVYFSGLRAHQMRETVYVTVYEGDTAVSNTLTYSVETYACNKQSAARVGELVKAMMRYGDAAAAYMN